MTISKLPEITLTCRDGHQIRTRARAGQSIKCQTCGAYKRVPAARPLTARELAATTAAEDRDQDHDDTGEMAARWESEPEWNGDQLPDWPGRPGDFCAECGGQLTWEPGRTWTNCDECAEQDGGVALPAAVGAYYERQAARRSEVAVRAAPDESASRSARARLRARKEMARECVGEWLETVADSGSYDRAQWQRQAAELAALLRGYLPEIDQAPDEATLAAVSQDVSALLASELGKALAAEYEEAQGRAERQQEAQQRAIEYEREQREAEARAERERQAAERERQAQIKQARERKAITGGQGSRTPDPYGIAPIMAMIYAVRKEKEQRLDEYGPCGYGTEHRKPEIPARRYWIMTLDWQGNDSGYEVPGGPQAVVCKKHFTKADAWIQEQAALITTQGRMRVRAAYTELT